MKDAQERRAARISREFEKIRADLAAAEAHAETFAQASRRGEAPSAQEWGDARREVRRLYLELAGARMRLYFSRIYWGRSAS